MKIKNINITFWGIVGALIVLSGIAFTIMRFTQGLGGVTALSDTYPWGLWVGFDVICGVGLAAGGFTIAAIVYIFGFEKYHPIVRPAVLTAFLGYILVVVGLLYDLGRPWAIWHAMIMWNPHSVMFEVAWCVMLYTTVLALEFSPMVMEKFKMKRALKVFRYFMIPIVTLGVILSTLHQSSLGSLFLIVPEKLHPFWYSPLLPVFFFISAVTVGMAMVILESYLSFRAFGKDIEMPILSSLGRYIVFMLMIYTALKIVDYANRGVFHLFFTQNVERYFLLIEFVVGVFIPMYIFAKRKYRENYLLLFIGAIMVVAGFIMNRLNTAITGFEGYHGYAYFPSATEIGTTLFVVTLGVLAYRFCVKTFPVFQHEKE